MSSVSTVLARHERLARQIAFVVEIDKLKTVLRRTPLVDGSRRENSAEHSWHLAIMAVLLAEYANEPVDAVRVVKMLLVHDLVEIDAGDTFIYDGHGDEDVAERERKAASRIFGLLPSGQAEEFETLWHEFEAAQSADARFAKALDRLQPTIHNFETAGGTWDHPGLTVEREKAIMSIIGEGSQVLWDFAEGLIDEGHSRGYIGGSQHTDGTAD